MSGLEWAILGCFVFGFLCLVVACFPLAQDKEAECFILGLVSVLVGIIAACSALPPMTEEQAAEMNQQILIQQVINQQLMNGGK